ncbi:MAG: 4-phosphoerythronate dehydrogenase [Prevotella sp.]|nr:4-phosphoerythronate dehydrogenase [Prevotella sp.]
MKIVVDDKIPYIRATIEELADEVVYRPGSDIGPDDVRDADALIVRTRTRCDERLLRGSRVQFVATATIGFDHIDADYMQRAGIEWMSCPGCNAGSVAQYVESVLLLLEQEKGITLGERTLGIVGCGHVGSRVRAVADRLGMRCLVCDPPLGEADFVPMDTIEREADIITFHVPLTHSGPYATHHLADDAFFHRLSRVPIIINTSRGGVVDNAALLQAMDSGLVDEVVLDVWEGEPQLNRELLRRVFIGTPHIAGYSADGKVNADNMVIRGLCRHFGLDCPPEIVPPSLPADFHFTGHPLELYNPADDSQRLKSHPESFESLRGDYPLRREFC